MRARHSFLMLLVIGAVSIQAWAQSAPLATAGAETVGGIAQATTEATDRAGALEKGNAPPLELGEEDLLLRLLLGVAFPLVILVALRLVRHGLRKWERRLEASILSWIDMVSEKRGFALRRDRYQRVIQALIGVFRIALFGALVALLALTWFALFPQTRPLATEFARGILSPLLNLLGVAARGILVLVYSAAVILAAVWLTRRMSTRSRAKHGSGLLSDHMLALPVRALVWIAAAVLILIPHDGVPRILAFAIVALSILALLLAARPLAEEVAYGIYLGSTIPIRNGSRLQIDTTEYIVLGLGAANARLERNGQTVFMSYSRIMKSTVTIDRPEDNRGEG